MTDVAVAPDIRKVSFNLPQSDIDALRSIARKRQTTVTEALRRAIALTKFVEDAEEKGSRLVIEDPDKSLHLLFIR